MSNNLIEVRNLVKHFEVSKSVFSRNKKIVKAVDGISFDINESAKNRQMRGMRKLSETGVGGEKDAAIEMIKKSNARRTVPQIFIEEKHIGGYEELRELEKSGELKNLLS